jgi:hypothetical protein
MMDMRGRLDPVRMARYADDWQRAVDATRDVLVELNRRVAAQLDQSWRGYGADASAAAVRDYVAGSVDGLVACRSVAMHLSELSRAAGDLRACITPPSDGALDDALAEVRELYSAPAVAAGNAVADIPPPPEPFEIGGQPAAGVLPAAAPATSTSPATVTPSGSAPLDAPRSAGAGYPTALPSVSSVAGDAYIPRMPTHSTAWSSSPSDALSARPEPASTAPSPATAGLPPTPASQTPGGASRAASAPISPFLGTAYPGYGGRDDGAEHRAPRYLISVGYTNELIGELPPVAPPVIGE